MDKKMDGWEGRWMSVWMGSREERRIDGTGNQTDRL